MKKLILSAAALIISAVLCGCSGEENASSLQTTAAGTEETTVVSTPLSDASGESDDTQTAPTLSELANAALSVGEWPAMAEISDADIILEDFEIDINDNKIEDIYIKKCPMSATMAEIIIIKSKNGEVNHAVDLLNARKQSLITKFAFYPSDKEIAEGALIGSLGDYAYMIAAGSAAEGKDALLAALG